ncbi:MAG: DUF1428 domain-containing protein [Tagaea sp.]|nr:DUF1428 domain-containing protein [Tagaea sp.]
MKYVDGFVLAVPARNKAAYLKIARKGAALFKSLGALRVVEAWQDDVPKGKTTDYFMAVKAKKSEKVVISWIEWPSKRIRDAGMKRMMADPKVKEMFADMPFDGKRMIFGGFAPILDAR